MPDLPGSPAEAFAQRLQRGERRKVLRSLRNCSDLDDDGIEQWGFGRGPIGVSDRDGARPVGARRPNPDRGRTESIGSAAVVLARGQEVRTAQTAELQGQEFEIRN